MAEDKPAQKPIPEIPNTSADEARRLAEDMARRVPGIKTDADIIKRGEEYIGTAEEQLIKRNESLRKGQGPL